MDRRNNTAALGLAVLLFSAAAVSRAPADSPPTVEQVGLPGPIVFVSRAILPNGSIYWNVPDDQPGVGPHSRFRVAAPGRLMLLEPNGSTKTLVDGGNPGLNRFRLIDVASPAVSYNGKKIVFAGFSSSDLDPAVDRLPARTPDGWRIFVINADGTDLRQLTFDGPRLDLSQLGSTGALLTGVDDADPVWLPDGRIVFSSTRWPAIAHYSGVRTSNLFVVNEDGSGLHRITAERNGADRPLVDPQTGRIVYARWWRNHRFADPQMDTQALPEGYARKDGLTISRDIQVGGYDYLFRNQWHAAVVNPDGTGLGMWTGVEHRHDASHYYGGSFTPAGDLVANYFPMQNMTEASGFGGLRLYRRGASYYEPLAGVTARSKDPKVHVSLRPISYGIQLPPYATEPEVLPDGRILFSTAPDVGQDYGLVVGDAQARNPVRLFDLPGRSEVQARLVAARPLPPIVADRVPLLASAVPPRAEGPYDVDGTFVFDALNVYANGPVDTMPMNAPPVGSADKIRFFADFQRTSGGSFPHLDWPILLGERPVRGDGSVREIAPANIPLFEQIRSGDGSVPLTTGGLGGATHVAGMNFGRPGEVARCVGCHPGHTTIPVPESDDEAKWTNLAPGAEVVVSSTRDSRRNRGLVDRRVLKGAVSDYWSSDYELADDQWVELRFPVPVVIRTVRLYAPRSGGNMQSTVRVEQAEVELFTRPGDAEPVAAAEVADVSVAGTEASFHNVPAQVVRVNLDAVSGSFAGEPAASLAEIEVIARGRLDAPNLVRGRSGR